MALLKPLQVACPPLLDQANHDGDIAAPNTLLASIAEPGVVTQAMLEVIFAEELADRGLLNRTGDRLERNVIAASGGNPAAPRAFNRALKLPERFDARSRGKNYSVGMPSQPETTHRGWSFDFPYPNRAAGYVHCVTHNPGSLAGKKRIVVRYRVVALEGTQFVPQEHPHLLGTVSLFFQRKAMTGLPKASLISTAGMRPSTRCKSSLPEPTR